jgi:DNA-binding IclR family transcriptional regulator
MKQTIGTLSKALEIIDELARSHEPVGISELSRRLDLTKNQVFRVLKTLEEYGYVHQSGERYQLGLKFIEVGRQILGQNDLLQLAIVHLNEVRDACGESSVIFVLDGLEAVCIAQREGHGLMDLTARVGHRYLLHAGAATKAILAFQNDELVDAAVAKHGLPAYTKHTITDADALKHHLAEIRLRGFAFSNEDVQAYASAVAVPIYNRDDRVTASMCVSGPNDRFTPEKRAHAVTILAGVCDRISAAQGARTLPGARIAQSGTLASGLLTDLGS